MTLPPGYAMPGTYPNPQPLPRTLTPQPANPQWAANPNGPARPAAPLPIIRAQAEDPPSSSSRLALRLPSPEELGVPSIRPSKIPQITFEQRLGRLGASGMQVDRLPQGGFRAHFLLPGAQPMEADGSSQAAALNLALDRAELSLRSQP
jgi:hypothetical protein